MSDPFGGTWTLDPTRSSFDPNHRPRAASMTWELDADGTYVLRAAGLDAKGERCEEKPQRLRPDGVAYPVEGLPGLTSVTTRPDPNTIRAEARREDSSLAGDADLLEPGLSRPRGRAAPAANLAREAAACSRVRSAACQRGAVLDDRPRHRLDVDVPGELVEIDAAEHLAAGQADVCVVAKAEHLDPTALPEPDLPDFQRLIGVQLVDAAGAPDDLDGEIAAIRLLRVAEDVALVGPGF